MSKSDNNNEGRATARPSIEFEDEAVDLSDITLADFPGLFVFWGLAIIVFLQFFTRYVLNNSLAWTEEIARYVLILLAFTAATTVTRKGTHIFLEFFYRYINPTIGKWLSVAVEVLTTVFYGYLVILGVELSLKTKTKMASAEIPKSLLYWVVTACLIAMTIYSFMWVIKKIRQSPKEVLKDIEEHSISE